MRLKFKLKDNHSRAYSSKHLISFLDYKKLLSCVLDCFQDQLLDFLEAIKAESQKQNNGLAADSAFENQRQLRTKAIILIITLKKRA